MRQRSAIGLILLAACGAPGTPAGHRPAPPTQAGTAGPVTAGAGPHVDGPINNPLDGGLVPLMCGAMPCPAADAAPPRLPDHDGFSVAEGDCDDFSDELNPGAYD